MRPLFPLLLLLTTVTAAHAATQDPPLDQFEPVEDEDEDPDPIVERDCLTTTEPNDDTQEEETNTPAPSAKLQSARARRVQIVAAARPKLERLIEDARQHGGKAQGPTARWIRRQFKYEPTTSFLMHLNHVLTVGLADAKQWFEPPTPRPPCTARVKHAVAELGGTKIWLCDPFYQSSVDDAGKTLFHEALHLHGIEDCAGVTFGTTPPSKRLCASNYEAMLDYLWREAP